MEIISPWHIYFIMQADSFRYIIGTLGAVGSIVTLITLMFIALVTGVGTEGKESEEVWKGCKKYTIPVLVISAVMVVLGTIIPTSKTAAAMFVVPAVVNSETVQTAVAD